jgi:hypothetical protein
MDPTSRRDSGAEGQLGGRATAGEVARERHPALPGGNG